MLRFSFCIRLNLRGEVVDGHDAADARGGGEVGELGEASALVLEAHEAETRSTLLSLLLGQSPDTGVADDHAEALLAKGIDVST